MGNRAPMLIPIRDHNPSTRKPIVTWGLIAINILVFLSYWGDIDDMRVFVPLFNNWALQPVDVSHGREIYTLISYQFLHGGFMHLAGNMLFLWIFGDNMEDELGHIGFLAFYLATGAAAGFMQVVADPNSFIPTVGASGAIAGVMGGYLLLFPKAKIDVLLLIIIFFKIFSFRAWVVLGIWFGFQVWSTLNGGDSGVAWLAHVGGFIAGVALMLPFWLRKGGTAFWNKTHGHPDHPESKYGPLTRSSIPIIRRRR